MKSIQLLFFMLCVTVFAEDIKTLDGQILKDATITKNDAIGVTVSHSDGITRVPYANLLEELRKEFKYDPNQAQAQATAERTAAMQQAQRAQAFENQQAVAGADAAANKALDEAAIAIVGKVLSVAKNGVLLSHATVGIPAVKDVVVTRNPLDGSSRYAKQPGIDIVSSDAPIFIYGVKGLVDEDQFSGKVFPAPNYNYTSAIGAAKTVRAFAATKEVAKQLLTK
ncbi:MAG: hypothetical protein WCK17_11015 [Verrucomicrobiota bacterium]